MPAFSEEQGIRPGRDHDRRFALGYNLDLFPTVISASAGHFGIAAQAWAGIDHVKVRIVGARMAFPDSTIGNSAFSGYELSVAAVIMDYVFGEGFSGFWRKLCVIHIVQECCQTDDALVGTFLPRDASRRTHDAHSVLNVVARSISRKDATSESLGIYQRFV
jgi:hypothetical protein